jgi:hypothetical protein
MNWGALGRGITGHRVAVGLLLLLAACGGGGIQAASQPPSASPPSASPSSFSTPTPSPSPVSAETVGDLYAAAVKVEAASQDDHDAHEDDDMYGYLPGLTVESHKALPAVAGRVTVRLHFNNYLILIDNDVTEATLAVLAYPAAKCEELLDNAGVFFVQIVTGAGRKGMVTIDALISWANGEISIVDLRNSVAEE